MHATEWIKEARRLYLEEAARFLHERALVPPGQTLQNLLDEWPSIIKRHFNPSEPDAFYRSWNGAVGASNLIVNIVDQFGRAIIVSALDAVFASPYGFRGAWLDYGCGTAAISLNWQRAYAPHSILYLADVENLPREFVRHSVACRPECDVRLVDIDLEAIPDGSLDFVMSIDVLEHLPTPSATYTKVHRKLRSGGMALLQAPWGNHPEHLDEAPIDWANNGGARLLETKYIKVAHVNPDVEFSGLYWKRLAD